MALCRLRFRVWLMLYRVQYVDCPTVTAVPLFEYFSAIISRKRESNARNIQKKSSALFSQSTKYLLRSYSRIAQRSLTSRHSCTRPSLLVSQCHSFLPFSRLHTTLPSLFAHRRTHVLQLLIPRVYTPSSFLRILPMINWLFSTCATLHSRFFFLCNASRTTLSDPTSPPPALGSATPGPFPTYGRDDPLDRTTV